MHVYLSIDHPFILTKLQTLLLTITYKLYWNLLNIIIIITHTILLLLLQGKTMLEFLVMTKTSFCKSMPFLLMVYIQELQIGHQFPQSPLSAAPYVALYDG